MEVNLTLKNPNFLPLVCVARPEKSAGFRLLRLSEAPFPVYSVCRSCEFLTTGVWLLMSQCGLVTTTGP